MKKFVLLILSLTIILFITSCAKSSAPKLELSKINNPQVLLYEDKKVDLDLEVLYKASIITDYNITRSKISWDNNVGIEKIEISYKKSSTSFEIKYLKLNELIERSDINPPTSIDAIQNIKYGTFRGTNEIVYYDKTNYIETNQFGYELSIDYNNQVVNKNINVRLIDDGFIISAHGKSASILESIPLGSYITYVRALNTAFIYEGSDYDISYYIRLQNLKTLIDKYKNIKDENKLLEYHQDLNWMIHYLMNENLDEFDEIYLSIKDKLSEISDDEYKKEYGISKISYDIPQLKNSNQSLFEIAKYDINHIGGFRNTDEMVLYKTTKNTNIHGYELAIDNNGYVVDANINVDIPENGFVLSGHGKSKDILQTIIIGDIIHLDEDNLCFTHLRNPFVYSINEYYEKVIKIIDLYNENMDLCIPLYYDSFKETIDEVVNEYKALYNNLLNQSTSFDNIYQYANNKLDNLLTKAYSYLLINNPVSNHCLWHTPGNLSPIFDETTKDGVKSLIRALKDLGINRIYLNILSHGSVFYKSKYLSFANEKFNKTYDEYKDYYECFINEAKKQDLEVYIWATVMNFGTDNKIVADKVDSSYYTKDYYGNIDKYLDSTNPVVQDYLCDIMKEIASYNPDGIEFDYIRYDSSNISYVTDKNSVKDYGYTEYAINKFMEDNHLEGDIHDLLFENPAIKQKWIDFKVNGVINSVIKMRNAIKSVNKNIKVTAAVFSNPTSSIASVMQDSVTFYLNDYVDELEPMIYKDRYEDFKSLVDHFVLLIESKEDYGKYFNIGLSPRLDGTSTLEYFSQISYCERFNYNYSIFSTSFVLKDQELMKYLKLNNNNSLSTNKSDNEKITSTLSYLKEILDSYYKYLLPQSLYEELIYNIDNNNINSLKSSIMKIENENIKAYLQSLIDKY